MSYNRFTVNLTYVEGIHPLAFYIIYFFDFLLYVDFPRVSPSAVLLSSADCLPVTYHRDVSRTTPALYWSVCVCVQEIKVSATWDCAALSSPYKCIGCLCPFAYL